MLVKEDPLSTTLHHVHRTAPISIILLFFVQFIIASARLPQRNIFERIVGKDKRFSINSTYTICLWLFSSDKVSKRRVFPDYEDFES